MGMQDLLVSVIVLASGWYAWRTLRAEMKGASGSCHCSKSCGKADGALDRRVADLVQIDISAPQARRETR